MRASTGGTYRKRLVVFDVDGVILDSRTNMERAWKAVCAAVGVTVPFRDYFALIGRPFPDIMTTLGLSHVADRCEHAFRTASAETLGDTPFYPGILDTLNKLSAAGVKLAILTSKDQARTTIVLRRLPVEFVTVQTPNYQYRGKPFPDQLIHTAAVAKEELRDTCYVGDTLVDAETAQRAGVEYYHAGWGYGDPPDGDCELFDTPADLAAFLDPVNATP